MRLFRPLTLSALATALAAPAAQAATLDPLNRCYRSVDESARETVRVQAGGFTPGAAVDVAIDGVIEQRVTALPDGSVAGEVEAPHHENGVRQFSLTVTERDRPGNTATAASRVAALSLRLKPGEARPPSRRVRFLGRGFTDGTEIYGHYLYGDKLRRTVLLGRPEGPCGRLNVVRRQIPVSRPRTGRWTLQVDNQATYSEQPPGVFDRLPIRVKRVPTR